MVLIMIVAHFSNSVAMYCKFSGSIPIANLRGDGRVATVEVRAAPYACDEGGDTCWVDTRPAATPRESESHAPTDALVLVKALCQIESAVPRNCAVTMRGIDRHCNVLPGSPNGRRIALPVLSSSSAVNGPR